MPQTKHADSGYTTFTAFWEGTTLESDQRIAFSRSRDGTRIAYALSGEGPPLVRAGTWLTHLQHDWDSVLWTHWFRLMSAHHTLVRYDPRGNGLSQRDNVTINLQHWVDDLACVVDKLELERFPLFGMSQGAGTAALYALQNPERVTHLTLYAPVVHGWRNAADPELAAHWEGITKLVSPGWSADNLAFTTMFAQLFIPGAAPEIIRQFAQMQQLTATADLAQRHLTNVGEMALFPRLQELDVPTLVIQVARDQMVPPQHAADVAGRIPGAEFVSLSSENHILLEEEPAWSHFLRVFAETYNTADPPVRATKVPSPAEELSRREREILRELTQGLSNREIGEKLFISEKTVRNHLTSIFAKLRVDTRARAIVAASQLDL